VPVVLPAIGYNWGCHLKKIIDLRNAKQMEIFIHSVVIPSVSRNGKRSKFHSKPFKDKEKHLDDF